MKKGQSDIFVQGKLLISPQLETFEVGEVEMG